MYNMSNIKSAGRLSSATQANYGKQRKMGFFQRWLFKQVQKGHEIEKDVAIPRSFPVEEVGRIDQPERAIRFTIYHANGGRVVETGRYDRKMDRHHNNLYIITADKDFGQEIDKIITLESLRQI